MSYGKWRKHIKSYSGNGYIGYLFLIISLPVIAADPRTLTFNTAHIPPYTTMRLDGFEDRLATEIFQRLGYQLRILMAPPERALRNVNEGVDDGVMSRVAGLEQTYTNLIRTQEVVVEWSFVAFTMDADIIVKGWDSLSAYNVAYVYGWKIFENNVTRYKSLLPVRTSGQLFQLLDAGRVDVVLFAELPGRWLAREHGLHGIRVSSHPLATKKKYFYMHNKHRDLIKQVDKTIRKIKQDGTYDRLFEQTITPFLGK